MDTVTLICFTYFSLLVETAGIEPASEKFLLKTSTSLVPERTGFFGLFSFVNILKPSMFTAFYLVYAHPTGIENKLVNSSLKTFFKRRLQRNHFD